jgi:hypothetical protein
MSADPVRQPAVPRPCRRLAGRVPSQPSHPRIALRRYPAVSTTVLPKVSPAAPRQVAAAHPSARWDHAPPRCACRALGWREGHPARGRLRTPHEAPRARPRRTRRLPDAAPVRAPHSGVVMHLEGPQMRWIRSRSASVAWSADELREPLLERHARAHRAAPLRASPRPLPRSARQPIRRLLAVTAIANRVALRSSATRPAGPPRADQAPPRHLTTARTFGTPAATGAFEPAPRRAPVGPCLRNPTRPPRTLCAASPRSIPLRLLSAPVANPWRLAPDETVAALTEHPPLLPTVPAPRVNAAIALSADAPLGPPATDPSPTRPRVRPRRGHRRPVRAGKHRGNHAGSAAVAPFALPAGSATGRTGTHARTP